MTDNEIIKALECCASECFNACDNCPFYKQCENDEQLSKFALDLINRQQAEIERLKKGCKKLVEKQKLYKDNMQATREFQIEQAKAEAIKEFAEKLCKGRASNDPVVIAVKAELKEMVGDTE